MSSSRRFARIVTALLVTPTVFALAGPPATAADTDSPMTPAPTSTVAGAPTVATVASTKPPAAPSPAAPSPAAPAPTPSGVAAVDHMATGRAAVAKSDWKAAVAQFSLAVGANPKDADANNMLGYSYRKSGDLTNAFKYYKIALTIDPKHTGALEYQGEAYVMVGKMAEAKANLAKLKSLGCSTKCEEYVDLAAFIAKPPKKKKK